MTEKRKAYEENVEAKLKEWSAEVALLDPKTDKPKADAKIGWHVTRRRY